MANDFKIKFSADVGNTLTTLKQLSAEAKKITGSTEKLSIANKKGTAVTKESTTVSIKYLKQLNE